MAAFTRALTGARRSLALGNVLVYSFNLTGLASSLRASIATCVWLSTNLCAWLELVIKPQCIHLVCCPCSSSYLCYRSCLFFRKTHGQLDCPSSGKRSTLNTYLDFSCHFQSLETFHGWFILKSLVDLHYIIRLFSQSLRLVRSTCLPQMAIWVFSLTMSQLLLSLNLASSKSLVLKSRLNSLVILMWSL